MLVAVILVAALAVSVSWNVGLFVLNRQLGKTRIGEANIYYNEFGVIPSTEVNSFLNPPISMYHALQIGLESEDWNKTSLKGMTVTISLMHGEIPTDGTQGWTNIQGPVTTAPASYSPTYGQGATYVYLWEITVNKSKGPGIPPLGFVLLDAATGMILPDSVLIQIDSCSRRTSKGI